ncbi:MAG: hypothetical protein M3305_02000 [Actinomycetota bacterium]|nr:hypothetical protein [Actinomycetota bacterium]
MVRDGPAVGPKEEVPTAARWRVLPFACATVFVVVNGTILPVALLQIDHALPPEPVALG